MMVSYQRGFQYNTRLWYLTHAQLPPEIEQLAQALEEKVQQRQQPTQTP
jgi:hypothetical protein